MTKKQDKLEKEAQEVRDLNPPNDPSIGPADIRPTAAEYERDRVLDEEDREEDEKRAEAHNKAVAEGKLPPEAQSLKEARKARDEAPEQAARDAEAKRG